MPKKMATTKLTVRSNVRKVILNEDLDDYKEKGWKALRHTDKNHVEISKKLKKWELFEVKMRRLFMDVGFKDAIPDIYNFNFKIGGYQLDAIGGVDRTLLIVDCTVAENADDGEEKNLLDKLGKTAIKKDRLTREVKKHFGKKYDNVVIAIVSEGARFNETDLKKAKGIGVFIKDSEFFEHCMKMAETQDPNLKYQIIRYLTGKTLPFSPQSKKPLRALAMKKSLGGNSTYRFNLDPETLLKLTYVHRIHYGATEGYQRPLKIPKLRDINEFLSQGESGFHNEIIISFDEEKACCLGWDSIKVYRQWPLEVELGWLEIPQFHCIAEVIDGQHRLYGYEDFTDDRRFEKSLRRRRKSDSLSVVAIEDPQGHDRAQTYITINSKQTKISGRDLWTLMGDYFPHLRMGYISNLIKELNRTGIFKNRIQIMGITKGTRSINIANFGKGIEDRRLVHITGKVVPDWNLLDRKEISDTYPEKPQTRATNILNVFFRAVRDSHRSDWDARGDGFLCTNNGINVMLRVLVEILRYHKGRISKEKILDLLRPEGGVNVLKDYIDSQEIGQLAKDTSSETNREKVATDIIEGIHKNNKMFALDYLATHDRI